MAVVEITVHNVHQTIGESDLVVICFYTNWSKAYGPYAETFVQASEQYPDVTFGRCDADVQTRLVRELEVTEVPTMLVFRDSVVVFSIPGTIPLDRFDELFKETRELNMAPIHDVMKDGHICSCGRKAAIAKAALEQSKTAEATDGA